MRKTLASVCLLAICLPAFAQDTAKQMKDFTSVLSNVNLSLSLMHLNDTTIPEIFEPPTLYSMRARGRNATMFYVQGTPKNPLKLDTTNFTIEQGGESIASVPVNIKNFAKGTATVEAGQQIDGVLVFSKLVDVAQPFTVRHGEDSVEIEYTHDQIGAMTVAPVK